MVRETKSGRFEDYGMLILSLRYVMILEKTQRKTESSVDGAAITGKWFAKKEQLKGNVMNSKDKMNFPMDEV